MEPTGSETSVVEGYVVKWLLYYYYKFYVSTKGFLFRRRRAHPYPIYHVLISSTMLKLYLETIVPGTLETCLYQEEIEHSREPSLCIFCNSFPKNEMRPAAFRNAR